MTVSAASRASWAKIQRNSAAKGSLKGAGSHDGRHTEVREEAEAALALPPLPDFVARAEARIQAARARG